MTDLIVRSADLAEGMRLFRAFENGDIAAVREVKDMFGTDAACFLCDLPAGDDFRLFITEDPRHPRTYALLSPLCMGCMAMPTQLRLNRVRNMLAAMFPAVRRHDVRLAPAAAFRP